MARLDGGGAGAAAPSSSAVGDTTVAAPMGKPMLEIFSHQMEKDSVHIYGRIIH